MDLFEKGWVCPKCGAVMSPITSCCVNCRGSKNLLDSNLGFIGTTPDIIRLKKTIDAVEENTQKIIDTWNDKQKTEMEGEWIKKEYDIDGKITIGIECNICGANRVAGLGLAKYCYMCGAKMKGK